jgi:hypothetical protein
VIDVSGRKIALYTTFPDLIMDNSEFNLLNALSENGYEVLVIINSTSTPRHEFWLNRKNRGFDLAAVRDAFRKLEGVPERLILVNSSVVWAPNTTGFIRSCEEKMNLSASHVLGLTQSLQRGEHAQSFFFMADQIGYESLKFAYSHMRNWRNKRAAVNFGEIRLSRILRSQNSEIVYMFPYAELVKKFIEKSKINSRLATRNLNPSHHFAREIIESGGTFYKRNLKDFSL